MAGQFHEPREQLSEGSLDVKRAIDSMMEELEAVDWYRQRMQAAGNPALRAILDHHQREEVEHFAMLLEWVRRNDADFDGQLRTYLFSRGDILDVEEAAETSEEDGGEKQAAGTQRQEQTEVAKEEYSLVGSPARRRTLGSLREAR